MSKMIKIEVNNEGHKQTLALKAQASGDGGLSVVCTYPSDPSGETAPFSASDSDVEKLRDTHFRDLGIMKAKGESGQFRLFTPVQRLAENRVKIEGVELRYEVDVDKTFDRVKLYGIPKHSTKEIQVTNTRLEDAVDFYLRHENRIQDCKAKFGNEAAFKYAISGEAKKDRASGYNM